MPRSMVPATTKNTAEAKVCSRLPERCRITMNPINAFSIYNIERVSDPRRLTHFGHGDEGRVVDKRDPRVQMETSAPPALERKRSLGLLLPVFASHRA